MNKNISAILIKPEYTIKETMEIIDKSPLSDCPSGIALIVNEDQMLIGIVTDGDIRSALIRGYDINQKVSDIMVTEPITVLDGRSPILMIREIKEQVDKAIAKKRLRRPRVDKVIHLDF